MGNWRTVQIGGHVDFGEVDALREALLITDLFDGEQWEEKGGPLSFTTEGSLFGLNDWVGRTIDTCGNIGKDCSLDDIVEHLFRLVRVAPSLTIVLDVGGEWESEDCVATIEVSQGQVLVVEPQVATVTGVTPNEGIRRLGKFFLR